MFKLSVKRLKRDPELSHYGYFNQPHSDII